MYLSNMRTILLVHHKILNMHTSTKMFTFMINLYFRYAEVFVTY